MAKGLLRAGLHILVVSQYFWPEDFRINELVKQLVVRGHEVTVLTGVPNYPDGMIFREFQDEPSRFECYHGARVVRAPMILRGKSKAQLVANYISFALGASFRGYQVLRHDNVDVIFVFEPSPVTVGVPAAVLSQILDAPIAFWVLDQWPEAIAASGAIKSKVLLRMVGWLVRFLYSRCDLILAQSKSLLPLIARYCRAGQQTAYLPNWVESTYETVLRKRGTEVPERDGCFSVMFAGNIGASQDFPAILNAAELLRFDSRIRWLIVGDGRDAGWVRAEIARRELHEQVLMLGRHPQVEMPTMFGRASALLVSLRSDPVLALTVPGKIQTYLAMGLPVIGMLDGEGARLIEEAGAGLTCASGDFQGLAALIRSMASMTDEERVRMGESGRTYVMREFDRDTLINQIEAMLGELSIRRPETQDVGRRRNRV